MARFLTAIFIALLITAPWVSQGAVSDWHQGATSFPRWSTDFSSSSFRQSMQDLQATGANIVVLHIPLTQSNVNSTDVSKRGDAPTNQSLIEGIEYIKSLGMDVALKFQVLPRDGRWSANINPSDRNTWFSNYGRIIEEYTVLAEQQGVKQLVLGNELISMTSENINSTNTQNWKNLISRVRSVYSGELTYSANWGGSDFANEKAHIGFWGDLDYIGIAAYFNLSGDGSVSSLKSSWQHWYDSDIKPLSDQWGKPVIFTEVGYRSNNDSFRNPWDWSRSAPANQEVQANAYEALFSFWNEHSLMQGVYWWDWSTDPNDGGAGHTHYTPQNKQAEEVMRTWFTSSPPPSGDGGEEPAAGEFTVTGSAGSVSANQSANMSIQVANNGGSSADNIVDIEIYNSSGAKVLQRFFERQSFSSGETKTYNIPWTPAAAGTYTVKAGIFNHNWSVLRHWDNNALTIDVGSGGSDLGGGVSGAIDIWWPTNGATVSGVQPFKAMIPGANISQYDMFWQVDGGGLVRMFDSNVDHPHKEFLVDLKNWNWRGSGPYTVNFVARDEGGAMITEKAVQINVSR